MRGQRRLPRADPVYSWVRLSLRIPVHIALDRIPPGRFLAAGMIATVTVGKKDGAAKNLPVRQSEQGRFHLATTAARRLQAGQRQAVQLMTIVPRLKFTTLCGPAVPSSFIGLLVKEICE